MAVNLDKTNRWKSDIMQSVVMYNQWFMEFAPAAFRSTRIHTTTDVETAMRLTGNLTNIRPAVLLEHLEILPTLRMSTCPPLAVDRLIGLAGVSGSLVKRMEEEKKLPVRMADSAVEQELTKIGAIIGRMADPDIFVWLDRKSAPSDTEILRAATIVADRLCGAIANPIIRNAQEKR
jgi:type II restriction enzyme